MYVLGIDFGFSQTRETSCYCALKIDRDKKEIDFLGNPVKFNQYDQKIPKLLQSYTFQVITLDAPLTPKHINEHGPAPKTGRSIEKAFSVDIFHSSRRGPQPSSIAVPKQGWPFYCAGMQFISRLRPYRYLSMDDIRAGKTVGIYEVIPKLTQSLLMPRDVLVNRLHGDQIDNFLFPLLFEKSSPYRYLLDNLLGGYSLSADMERYISYISMQIKVYHEELAAIVSALQAFLIYEGKAAFIGFSGEHEAYYALPCTAYWQREWLDCFEQHSRRKHKDMVVFQRAACIASVQNAVLSSADVPRIRIMKNEQVKLIQEESQPNKSTYNPEKGKLSTRQGYINKNNQKNMGKSDQRGTGNQQWFYNMQCLNCGHSYHANGHDIWLRKCPACQGGMP